LISVLSRKVDLGKLGEEQKVQASTYGTRYFSQSVHKYEIPGEGMPAYAAYRLIHDELNLDGNPPLCSRSIIICSAWA
jgi:glutamate decarboxylase